MWVCRSHLLRGHLSHDSEAACRDELMSRVEKTLLAAQKEMCTAFDGHVHEQVQGFVDFLTRNGSHYRYVMLLYLQTEQAN